jgi:CDP-glucose 4,6-dehydratase
LHYLITGHTGFKGAWLAMMLNIQGHEVSGISLDPAGKSLYRDADLTRFFVHDIKEDIRDLHKLKKAFLKVNPDVLIHLAAQPLVRESYRNPLYTFETNVMGTLNVLESASNLKDLKSGLIVTTDKVYMNHDHKKHFVESDELGGRDPYSASKAAADIAAQSWIESFVEAPISIARAGNVIGGGDWAQDRIVPELVTSFSEGKRPILRYPNSIRPWQHVLDCLNGYLLLTEKQMDSNIRGVFNFGPSLNDQYTVADLVDNFGSFWGISSPSWTVDGTDHPHESGHLLLDSTKARNVLGWSDKLSFLDSVKWTADWYQKSTELNPLEIVQEQINEFISMNRK